MALVSRQLAGSEHHGTTTGVTVKKGGTVYLCPHCTQPIEPTEHGLVAPHLLTTFSELRCKGEGQQPVWDEEGARHDTQLAQRPAQYLAAPEWLPSWQQRHVAALSLPASGALRIWLPHTTSLGHIASIDDMMRTRTRPVWDPQRECWTVPKNHFLVMVGRLLGRHRHLILGREYNPNEKCNSRCKNAQGPYCTCSCLAKYHGHGRWMKGFTPVDEFRTRYRGESWNWMVVTHAANESARPAGHRVDIST